MPEPAAATATPAAAPAHRRNRLMWTIVVGLALGALCLWGSAKLTWNWSIQTTVLHGQQRVAQPGSDVQPALVPLALLGLAGIAAVLAIGGWFRRVVGGLLALAGLVVWWLSGSGLPGVFGGHPDGYPRLTILGAHALALVGGLLLVGAGVQVVRGATRLPKLGGSYQTPSAAKQSAKRSANTDAQLWQALSEGRDPTQD